MRSCTRQRSAIGLWENVGGKLKPHRAFRWGVRIDLTLLTNGRSPDCPTIWITSAPTFFLVKFLNVTSFINIITW